MSTWKKIATLLMAITLVITSVGCQTPWKTTPGPAATPPPGGAPAARPDGPVTGYLAVAPRILRAGQRENVSVSLFYGRDAAHSTVQVALLQDGRHLASASGYVDGRGDLALEVPRVAEGDYQLRLSGRGFRAESPVRVEEGTLLFVETDKPIYKPGQTIHIRTLTLDPELKPVTGAVEVEVMDAKGLKVFKREVVTDDYGMTSFDLPLSPEPNLGVWKIVGKAGKRTTQLDVRVERYVLPKYEISVELAKNWVLASEPIKGTVAAEYSYGKSVKGEVEITATRYVGTWQEFAKVTRDLDGRLDFELPAVQYVSGVPGAKGQGNVNLDIVVREKSTGYEEKTSRLLTVASAPVNIQIIPDGTAFKPSLPMSLLVVAETPDRQPVDATVRVRVAYTKKNFNTTEETHTVAVKDGKALFKLTPPADAISLALTGESRDAHASLVMQAGYSPTGSFLHLEQVGGRDLTVGDTARFRVASTRETGQLYYEIVSRGKVVYSDYTRSREIEFTTTPLMAPGARLLVYQILPSSEVAADYLPFVVSGDYPHQVQASFGRQEARPGEEIDVHLQTEGPARVGLVAVDRSVFILAENRLNLQQVFAELERLYLQPQAELHEARPIWDKVTLRGAGDVFRDAGVVVISNQNVPDSRELENPNARDRQLFGIAPAGRMAAADQAEAAKAPAPPMATPSGPGAGELAEVQRVRQFFPETWIWAEVMTDRAGRAGLTYTVPDSITTWMLRAVALSKDTGLGIAEAQLRVLQPFFVQIDLPYATIRGEEFPVKVALYNYTDVAQEFAVELEEAAWFDLLSESRRTLTVGPNDVGGASFTIRPRRLGPQQVKVTARSRQEADAIVKDIIVEPEGVAREQVENLVISAGASRQLDLSIPDRIIDGSARAYLALTGSYLTQSIEGLEGLLQMPFGCGEQNMILLAPNVFITEYLRETGQMKPEVMAKAEMMMVTGYQRQLTYRRSDGSFSAFGSQDKEGSLWLTSFVLKTFAQARDQMYVDDAVLESAKAWIAQHQKADGSFAPVGFVHHQEMLGGLQGTTALTAYVAIALMEAGESHGAGRAIRYLEGAFDASDDPYAVAITTYALEMAESPRAAAAHEKLLSLSQESDEGLYWGGGPEPRPLPEPAQPGEGRRPMMPPLPGPNQIAAIETTAYATLALVEHGDRLNASRAARWLVSQRNAFGGFGSTQDTVVGLQALTRFAADSRADVDATVVLKSGDWRREARVTAANADVLQVLDVPMDAPLEVEVRGRGQVVLQTVRRYNVPEATTADLSVFQLSVDYGIDEVEVNDLIEVRTAIKFTPPMPLEAGMVVLDVAVPTGFAPVTESLDALVAREPSLKRYEVAGRKVILYIEDMRPNQELRFTFQAVALFPVRAQAVTSQVYAYYRTEWKGENLGGAMVVR